MIYRAIIDDVIANIKSEFDDYGVGEDVLGDLQSVSLLRMYIVGATSVGRCSLRRLIRLVAEMGE